MRRLDLEVNCCRIGWSVALIGRTRAAPVNVTPFTRPFQARCGGAARLFLILARMGLCGGTSSHSQDDVAAKQATLYRRNL